MTRRSTSSCGAAALLLLSTTVTTTSGFVVVVVQNNPARTPATASSSLLTLHATTEGFQRSLLAAQIANKKSNNNSSAPTNSATTTTQSVDYDAAARLAYESSSGGSSTNDFTTFKAKYLQDTSTLMATKHRTRIAKEKAAAAKEKAQKAAEAAQLAKEKAQAKMKEREVEVAAATAAAAASKQSNEDDSSPATVPPIPPKTPPPKEEAPPKPVVTAEAAAETTSAAETESSSSSSSSTKGTQFTVPRELALVPINESTVQFTAGTLGALAGLLLGGGPFLAIFLSATANYLSRKDDEPLAQPGKDIATYASPKRIVDTASQTALLIYNFLAQFERDYKIVDGTFKLLEGAVDKAKQSEESGSETIVALESTLGGVAKNIEKLNQDFDLVGGAGTVLNSVGDLVENSVDKVVKLNEEYKLTDRMGGVVKGAVAKATEKRE